MKPNILRYLLEYISEPPVEGSPLGMVMGGDYEGWFYSERYRRLWMHTAGATDMLKELTAPLARKGWKRSMEGNGED